MIIEGVQYHRFVFTYRDRDSKRRQKTIWAAPAYPYAVESFDRVCGFDVKPGSNVRVR